MSEQKLTEDDLGMGQAQEPELEKNDSREEQHRLDELVKKAEQKTGPFKARLKMDVDVRIDTEPEDTFMAVTGASHEQVRGIAVDFLIKSMDDPKASIREGNASVVAMSLPEAFMDGVESGAINDKVMVGLALIGFKEVVNRVQKKAAKLTNDPMTMLAAKFAEKDNVFGKKISTELPPELRLAMYMVNKHSSFCNPESELGKINNDGASSLPVDMMAFLKSIFD